MKLYLNCDEEGMTALVHAILKVHGKNTKS